MGFGAPNWRPAPGSPHSATPLGVGGIFLWVGSSWVFQRVAKRIFFRGGNSGETSFYPLITERKTFFYWNFQRKISKFKIQGGPWLPLPTPMTADGVFYGIVLQTHVVQICSIIFEHTLTHHTLFVLVKQTQFCVSFIVQWSPNGSF